ncbi:tripartite tricarboxylate transporter TctB family protein [Pseudomonas matsuisoli]|uniref:DUF1468 domain-containing protein n=1 Tax=Pseudomonas matsuisoli TaxID=1515666 RepID=A0A917UZH3_9PSED|nr:tripartite tricarboxylate transporter TctB family protein [Pseudomonas matsuisoli]GGK00978.1 hypothetical protein GCM10009304_28520 [Pseudomonas matsuisoli]
MNKNRLILGFFGIAVAIVFFVDALQYPEAAAQMPLIYSVLVALLSLAMVGTELFGRRRTTAEVGNGSELPQEAPIKPRYLATAVVFLLAVAYMAALNTLGYLLSSVLFMAAALLVIRTVSLRFAVIGAAVLIAVVCLVFITFLGLPVPMLPPAIS